MKIYPNLIDKTISGICDWILKVTQYRAQDVTDNDTLNQEIQTLTAGVAANTSAIGAVLPAVGTVGNVLTDSGTAWISEAPAAQPPAFNSIGGLIISAMSGSSTTAVLTISKGGAADSAGAKYISVAGNLSWAASNGNAINGTDAASSTLANSTTYHVFICSGASGTGSFVSASLTPTFPTGYAVSSRRIGSFKTTGAGAPIPYTVIEVEGGATINWLTTQVLDMSAVTVGITRILTTLSVPSGIKMGWLYRMTATAGSGIGVIITSGDETDVAPTAFSGTAAPLFDFNYYSSEGEATGIPRDGLVTTNTSAQIGTRASSASSTVYAVTRGWRDFRRS